MKAIILNASAWMIVPVMDAFAKYLSSSMDVLQITWARYFFTVVFTLSLMLIFYRHSLVWTKKPALQLIRGLIFVFSTYLFFYAISEISLPKALTLAFVAPICVTALSPFFLNEKVGVKRWTAVSLGFVGTLIVIRPGFIELNLATMAALGNGICYGFYLIITRKLSTSDNPLLTLLLSGLKTLKDRRKDLCLTFAKRCVKNEKTRDMFPLNNEGNGDKKKHEKYKVYIMQIQVDYKNRR